MSEQESQSTPGRPLPDLPAPNDSSAGSEQLDLDSGNSDGGRCHAPATVSKTSFTVNTPASQKRAIQRLKQSLTFSDQSPHSSADSSPHKTNSSENYTQSGQSSTHSLQGSTHSAPPTITALPAVTTSYTPSSNIAQADEGEGAEYVSEGEAPSGISISAILSKLDQVKSCLQEAEALHMQMKQRLSEPGMTAQVNKMGKLVEDLRRQESGYLGILLKLLDQQGHDKGRNRGRESEEASEDEGSEGEMPSEGEQEQKREEANDSLSLRAELLKDQMAAQHAEQQEQEEELRMLRQQRDLLRNLLEQQKQIEDLESRQRGLLEQKSDAEAKLASTVRQNLQGQPTAAVQSQDKPARQEKQPKSVSEEDETASGVATKLRQLRERQARVVQLTTLLNQLKAQTEEDKDSHLPNARTGAAKVTKSGTTAQPHVSVAGSSELVALGHQALPAELQQKLKQAEEARAKLNELQDMLSLLQELDPGAGAGHVSGAPQPPAASGQGMVGYEREVGQENNGEDDSQSEGELEQSVLSEYEERLVLKREEVTQLQEQRDQLLATQRKLQELQQKMTDASPSSKRTGQSEGATSNGAAPVLSSQLASELGRQRRLYDDLLNKTQQIQSMVDEVASARDVTAATWGGSSVASSEDGEDSTASLPGPGGLDDTREDLHHTHSTTLGDSAVAAVEVPGSDGEQDTQLGGEGAREGEEGLVFRVTRHTPRQLRGGLRGGHRRMLTPEGSPHSAGKRMKLDVTSSAATSDKGTKSAPSSAARPAIGSYCAVWPGVIFPPPSRKQTREEATQTGELATVPGVPGPSLVEEHISLLHHQLGVATTMAGQLAYSQQGLISAMCRQLESLQLEDRIQDHFARLHQYQAELEQYYQELQNVYFKPPTVSEAGMECPSPQQLQQQQQDREEEVDGDQEEPIFGARLSPQPPFTSTTVSAAPAPTRATASAAAGATAGFNMAAPLCHDQKATLTEAALSSQQSEAFTQQTTGNSFQHVPPMPRLPGEFGSNLPSRRTSQGLPPALMSCFPRMYQHQHQIPEKEEEDGAAIVPPNEEMPGSFVAPAPPPPLAPYFHPSPYAPYHPWMPPTPYSTMPHPHHALGLPHPPSLRPSPAFMSAPRVPFYSPYTRYRLSWPPATFPVSPHYPAYPGYFAPGPPGYDPGAGYGLNSSNTFSSSYPHAGFGGEAGMGGVGQRPYSPSGVTGVSMQVQPPSSPPSAPSVSNLHNTSSSLQPSTGSGLLHQSSSSTLQAPTTSSHTIPTKPTTSTSLPPHPVIPPLTTHPHTLTAHLTNTASTHSKVASEWRGMEERGGERKGGMEEGARPADTHTQDEESLSSIPLSFPDASGDRDAAVAAGEGKPPEDFSVFDALRDTIYSEVATLIANNENRPHFLVELFRELQMLSSDYLRQRALYSLQDLVTRYLTEESLQQRQREGRTEQDNAYSVVQGLQAWVGSEPTPSESLVTSDDEVVRAKPSTTTQPTAAGGDYVEPASSTSPHSTPPNSQFEETPFAADNLGETVVRLDKAMARLRESYLSGGSHICPGGTMRPPMVSPCPLASADLSQSSQSESYAADINTEQLDEQIKTVMTEVIPLLKEHMTTSCSSELLQQIKQLVMRLVLAQLKEQNSTIVETFSKQLDTTLHATLLKYLNKMLKECGEALLVEVSEVLFNELAFFRLMQTMGVQKDPDFRSVTSHSQTTTENEEEEGGEQVRDGERKREGGKEETLPELQVLSAAVAQTLIDEQEALGKLRDDEFAKEWDSQLQDRPSSPSLDEEQTVLIELSTSESKPIQSVGSGEEDVEGGAMQQEATSSDSQPDKKRVEPPPPTGEREETPPTPVIAAVSPVSAGGDHGESAGTSSGGSEQTAQSPPPGLSNVALEVQMKTEQQSTEGIAGILATMEQEQELAGESDPLPQPGQSEVIAEP